MLDRTIHQNGGNPPMSSLLPPPSPLHLIVSLPIPPPLHLIVATPLPPLPLPLHALNRFSPPRPPHHPTISLLSPSSAATPEHLPIPHPSDALVNVRVQTSGDPAREVLKDACLDLMLMCRHVRSTFDKAVEDFRVNEGVPDSKANERVQAMNIDSEESD
ncbi:hypothetical protein Dsin_023665 [Dipteronia sinensis]|uniref:DNA-directed RNA polymerase RBP11-like dimerisation domain-containing protein n=1 Tax=Dipteronia sinensis TaxID=43782 RepID=A0AAE0A3S5_9ROSI|nr:hypothetical protein Dsin_023665 [Dipteronia sinensis]